MRISFPGETAEYRAARQRLKPVWNLFDLTTEGRPTDWDEQLPYR